MKIYLQISLYIRLCGKLRNPFMGSKLNLDAMFLFYFLFHKIYIQI